MLLRIIVGLCKLVELAGGTVRLEKTFGSKGKQHCKCIAPETQIVLVAIVAQMQKGSTTVCFIAC